MPLYAFTLEKPDGTVVLRFDLQLPVAERDDLALRRVQVPDRVALAGVTANPFGNMTMRCLHRAEERMGNSKQFYQRLQLDPNKPMGRKELIQTYREAHADNS